MAAIRMTGRAIVVAMAIGAAVPRSSSAQAPVIEESGLPPSGMAAMAGARSSLLGSIPGGGANLGMQPGRDEMLFGGRPGPSVPRVPGTITMPGGTYQGPRGALGVVAPQPLPVPQPPFFGTLEVGEGPEDQGPPGGLSLDQAVDLYVHQNLGLRALALELPQARADVLTASLRANPILYADGQLVPYGSYNKQRPGGPTQYDLNISHPIDYSHKRRARMNYAELSLRVMEHQYQDAVRRGIGDLCLAFVDALAARRTVHYAEVNARGVDEILKITETQFRQDKATSADVEQARSDGAVAAVSLEDAREALLQRKRTLAAMLNLPPSDADRLELRGALEDLGPTLPPDEELFRMALQCRADVASFRLGVEAAQAAYQLARANRFADAYLLYQPFTYQNNAPFGTQSATSWALGITVPLPVYNRNQGNIERARINIHQSQVQLSDKERQVVMEVQQAIGEHRASGRIVADIRERVLPVAKKAVASRMELFREGEVDVLTFQNQRRNLNDKAKAYLDTAARHRKAMLTLNMVVGQRLLP
jgi:cobalt-zinc-cadmium efflux system outer membrane protein